MSSPMVPRLARAAPLPKLLSLPLLLPLIDPRPRTTAAVALPKLGRARVLLQRMPRLALAGQCRPQWPPGAVRRRRSFLPVAASRSHRSPGRRRCQRRQPQWRLRGSRARAGAVRAPSPIRCVVARAATAVRAASAAALTQPLSLQMLLLLAEEVVLQLGPEPLPRVWPAAAEKTALLFNSCVRQATRSKASPWMKFARSRKARNRLGRARLARCIGLG
mmetsp:Transcript_47023/g.118465  ORF Transcript_47023/g.118465 Transcript_47023/m.118465 type:complete len:219 (-) Transcript_47023:2378-3034(-)